MNDKNRPIGIFDSGIGGLSVVKRISKYLPKESLVYFGDTARVPYGSKSNSTVIEYSLEDAGFLLSKNVKMIVVACNTASSVALPALRERFGLPVIGMIEPGSRAALNKTETGKIGVIGTMATISNKAYSIEIKRLSKSAKVYEKACPLFVPLAEEGWLNHEATYLVAKEYLSDMKSFNIDTLILGCTHYPLLQPVIQAVIGDYVSLIDSGRAASLEVKKCLEEADLLNDSEQPPKKEFYVSDIPLKFKRVAERFLGHKIECLEKIDVDRLESHS